ncbi:MAG TPA: hypothetical protein VER03_22775 [Bryobacteraceae bacterium]|nr:hypothetical protein [Bryobacteraceae bacterium]
MQPRRRSGLEKAALAIFILGTIPLAFTVVLQKLGIVAADANPVGLGLLFGVAVLLAMILAIASKVTQSR